VALSRRLLVSYRALGLGDFLTAVPALRALTRAFPDHRHVLAAPRALRPLAELSGAVDAVADVAALAPLPPALHRADVAVNLHGRGPQSHRLLLASRPARVIAFEDAHTGVAGPEWQAGEHERVRWCRLLREHGIAADPDDLELRRPVTSTPAIAAGATLLHPGAASGARRWPVERWAAIARSEREAGREVVLTGAPQERGLADAIARSAGLADAAVLAGRTDALELAGAVASVGCVVCGDTGVAHLATALRTPSVVLFGPSSPAEWGPPPGRVEHQVLWAGVRGDPHARTPDPGLLAITPADVIAALGRVRARR
jgi:ADP-heptose:LPS heptosyltransferase